MLLYLLLVVAQLVEPSESLLKFGSTMEHSNHVHDSTKRSKSHIAFCSILNSKGIRHYAHRCLKIANADEKLEAACLRAIFNADYFWN